jgi:hypothetical protein
MIQKLLNYLLSSLGLSKKTESPDIPNDIGNSEKLCRAIYSPINIKNKSGAIDSNIFKTPPDKDEVSVNRIDFTTPIFCKTIAKRVQIPPKRNYYGFAIILQNEVLISGCTTVYSPIKKPKSKQNLFHSDIKVGYTPTKGIAWPGYIRKKVDDMAKKARFYKDPNIETVGWEGENLI